MCDYSLHGVAPDPQRWDKPVTTQFLNTTTRGFSAVEEPRVAVCLLPGTEVAFEKKVERHLTKAFSLFGLGLMDQHTASSDCRNSSALDMCHPPDNAPLVICTAADRMFRAADKPHALKTLLARSDFC